MCETLQNIEILSDIEPALKTQCGAWFHINLCVHRKLCSSVCKSVTNMIKYSLQNCKKCPRIVFGDLPCPPQFDKTCLSP